MKPEPSLIPTATPSLKEVVTQHGSLSTSYTQAITDDFTILSGGDIADIAHFLCVLHGSHPSVLDHAATRTNEPLARDWLVQAMDGFTTERAFITKLTVSAGPIIGLSIEDQSNAAVIAQRKALEMLSQSDRNGCALGASFALVLDWQAIRPLLEKIALKLGVEPHSAILPPAETTDALSHGLTKSSPIARAINFGVDQLLAQHRGLWQLLEARRNARLSDWQSLS
ncbi:DUF6975 family protein [Parasphingorhabdus sp.]|uniref:DUF6975 family protein n=1 Tax=Parasphingorhabdus sp. TaxID=2709688 RepID=UPI002F92839F